MIEKFCNLGYADGCAWAPVIRDSDAIRFAVSSPPSDARDRKAKSPATILHIHFVRERNHRPVDHGSLEYDLVQGEWLRRNDDARIQKMAECFLASYMKRKA